MRKLVVTHGDDGDPVGRLSGIERRDHAWGAQPADDGPKLHANRKGRVRAGCGSLVRTVSHQGLRTVPLLVRPLLIDLVGHDD
jgi:hypothetical protein